MYTIDLDVGGTFTDGFFSDGQTYRTAKVPTTAHDVPACVLECVAGGAAAFGTDTAGLLREASVFRLATTIGTNIIVQGRGAKSGLLVSAGGRGEPVWQRARQRDSAGIHQAGDDQWHRWGHRRLRR